MSADSIFEKFSISHLDKYSLVDPSLLSRFQLHVAAHPDPEACCILADLFRAVHAKEGLFYAKSLERLDETSRDLADQLISAKLLNVFPPRAWNETYQLIAELPCERGGLAMHDASVLPAPAALGSLAWMRDWMGELEQTIRRRASVAWAFASERAGFDHFKYLWGAPAAAGVLAAFLGLVYFDERLGLRRLVIDSAPVTWLAETLSPETDTQPTDADPVKIPVPMINLASDNAVREAGVDQALRSQEVETRVVAALPTVVPLALEAPREEIVMPQAVAVEEVSEKTFVVASKLDRAAEPNRRVSSPAAMPARKQASSKPARAGEEKPNPPVAETPAKPPLVVAPQINPPGLPREPHAPAQPPAAPLIAVSEPAKSLVQGVIARLPENAWSEPDDEASEEVAQRTRASKMSKSIKTAESTPDFLQRLQGRNERSAQSGGEDALIARPSPPQRSASERVARSGSSDRIYRPDVEDGPERPIRPDFENHSGKTDRMARPVIQPPERIARPSSEGHGRNFDRVSRQDLRAAERIERRLVERVERIHARTERPYKPERGRH